VFAVGGNCVGNRYLPTAESYDPLTDTWGILSGMPTGRSYLAVAALAGQIYALGGDASGTKSAKAERLDARTGAWCSLPDMPTAREGLAAASCRGRVYAIGGMGGPTVVEHFEPAANLWTAVACLRHSHYLAAACGAEAIYVFGGFYDKMARAEMERCDPSVGTWEQLPDMPVPRQEPAAVCVETA